MFICGCVSPSTKNKQNEQTSRNLRKLNKMYGELARARKRNGMVNSKIWNQNSTTVGKSSDSPRILCSIHDCLNHNYRDNLCTIHLAEMEEAGEDGSLNAMLAIVKKKERQAKQLEEAKRKEARRKIKEEEAAVIENQRRVQAKKDAAREDIRKYMEIVSSKYGKDMKEVAWESLVSLHPEGKDLTIGDIDGFRRILEISSIDTTEKAENENVVTNTSNADKAPETIHVGYTSYKVLRSWWSGKVDTYNNPNLNLADAMYLFIEIIVRNDDTKSRSIPPFSLVDESGTSYSRSGENVEGSFGMFDSLNPDVSKKGVILFDVPVSHGYKLKVSGGFWSGKSTLIKLSPMTSKR